MVCHAPEDRYDRSRNRLGLQMYDYEVEIEKALTKLKRILIESRVSVW